MERPEQTGRDWLKLSGPLVCKTAACLPETDGVLCYFTGIPIALDGLRSSTQHVEDLLHRSSDAVSVFGGR